MFIFEPLFDERASAVEVAHHVSERDVVALGPGQYADRCSLDSDGDLFGFTHFFCASMKAQRDRYFGESIRRRREKQVAKRGFRAGGRGYLDQSCAVVC